MKYYDVKCFNSSHVVINNDKLAQNVEDLLNSYTEPIYDENNAYHKFKTFIPLFDTDGCLDRYYVIFSDDEPKYTMKFIRGKEELEEEFTKDKVNIILLCNKVTINNQEYRIIDKNFNTSDLTVTCLCE